MLGGASGLTVHATAAALGVSALLATSATAYTTLKLIGIAYLLFLGARMLTVASRPDAVDRKRAVARDRPFAQGLVSNALNPKVALFFLTFVPQFLPDRGATLPTGLALSGIFAALYLIWFSALVTLVELVANTLRQARVQAWMERVTGGALIAFAVRLGAQGRP
jgi:threonine/homoserine/homoserine lactone efflux protein